MPYARKHMASAAGEHVVPTQAAIRERRQWHPSVVLDDFVKQVVSLGQLVDIINTSRLSSFDNDTVQRSIGWGLYIEEVVESLTMDWQREMLSEALTATSKTGAKADVPTLSCLRQARTWILQSLLGSRFLVNHPEPQSLLTWIVTAYAELAGPSDGAVAAPTSGNRPLPSFVEDVTDVMTCAGATAALSHAYSALTMCTAGSIHRNPCRGSPIKKNSRKRIRQPTSFELSVETAQRRAYASNCYKILLSKHGGAETEGRSSVSDTNEMMRFIVKIASLARTDPGLLDIMCLMLLETRRTDLLAAGGQKTAIVDGTGLSALQHINAIILEQVLTFSEDLRLWSLDPWLLTEVSHHYVMFADKYLSHLLRSLRQTRHQGGHTLRTWNNMDIRRDDLVARLKLLSQRSESLGSFCEAALRLSANALDVAM